MKRFLTSLFTLLLLTATLCVTASASDFDAVAEDLSAIGMFRGTANGFELDRAPTRSEAAIMLVRLYGAEETAKTAYGAGEISHPFTDVSAFTSPYVAWLYTNGITNGFTETTFASQRPCSAQNYVVFLLRALGYEDGKDFEYADAMTFAQEKGFYDPITFSGEFLRDDLAAITYQGLAADMADGKTYLLDSLIESGAIDKTAAKTMTETIEAYRAMQTAMAKVNDEAMDMDIEMDMDMAISVDGMGTLVSTTSQSTGNMKMLVKDQTNVQMAYIFETTVDGVSMESGMWMKDGWVYQSVGSGEEVTKIKQAVSDELAAIENAGLVEPSSMDVSGLAMLESVSSKKDGSNTVYTMVIREDLGGALEGVANITGEDAADLQYGAIEAIYTIDRSGNLKKIEMDFSASMEDDLPMEDGVSLPTKIAYGYNMVMTINATGSKVKISWPDFSDFMEISNVVESPVISETTLS